MTHVDALVCRLCGTEYAPDELEYTCPDHEGVRGVLDVRYDYERIREAFDGPLDGRVDSLWKYAPFLPVDESEIVSLGAGGTPLLDAPALSERLDVETVVKNEGPNPTGANKDRGSAVVATRARQRGHDVVTCASTGNAAASLAGYAARAGLDCRIFVPADVPEAKAVQPLTYGATVLAVDGSYEDAYELCRAVSAERGWYSRNAAMNPYAVEGNRTLGFEIAEQAPEADWVVMPMGNGCSLTGAWKGLREFERLGYLDSAPRMLGVQAAGASAIYDLFVGDRERDDESSTGRHRSEAADASDRERRRPGPPRADGNGSPTADRSGRGTSADSIDVTAPHNAAAACHALSESGGDAVLVDDDAILAAQRLLGETEGIFAEPASAAAVAGLRRAREEGTVAASDRAVVVATGTGLKDTATARRATDDVIDVAADPDAVPEDL